MSILKICLLISDDPDDQQILSEAIKEISERVVVINCVDINIIQLLKEQKITPHYIILDTFIDSNFISQFIDGLHGIEHLTNTPIILLANDLPIINNHSAKTYGYINKNLNYSDIKTILKKHIKD